MAHDSIPEDREQSFKCHECETGTITQCSVTKDWVCDTCQFWAENEDEESQ